jgi:protein phosphatase methylesterase 1
MVQSDSESDSEGKDEEMEATDGMGDLPMPQSMFAQPPPKFTGRMPVKPPASMPHSSSGAEVMGDKPKIINKPGKSYEPIEWSEVFTHREMVDNTIPVYYTDNEGPVIFCIHGAGHSALSFGPFAKY